MHTQHGHQYFTLSSLRENLLLCDQVCFVYNASTPCASKCMKEFKYHNRSNGAQSSCLAAIAQHCKACKAESIQHGKTASSRKSFLHRYAPHYNAQIRNTQSIPCILYLTGAGSQCHHDASCRMAAENTASMDPYSFGARQQASKNSSLQHCTTTPGTIANFELHRAGSWCAALLLQSAVEAHHLCLQPATTRLWCRCNQQFQDAANCRMLT